MATSTHHASVRSQQRCIPPLIDQWLDLYGQEEYSGAGFAVMKWGISLKQLVVLQMFVGVFIPWGQMLHFSWGGLVLAVIIALVKLVVGVLVIALFENSMARLRFLATSRITWTGFGLAFLAFVSLLVA